MNFNEWNWLIEKSAPGEAHMRNITKTIFTGKTKFQEVAVIETQLYGKCLILDGQTQSSLADEIAYHEMLVHPAMITHPNPKNVLIIGGGEGATLREVVKYKSVERIVMVDIDEEVVNICREFLPEWHQGAFEDKRVELLHLDARKYIKDSNESFDVIIIDLTEPLKEGPSYLLFTKEFYKIVKDKLTESGVLSLQAGSTHFALSTLHTTINNTLKQVFTDVHSYQTYIPSFDTMWGFILAGTDNINKLTAAQIDERIQDRMQKQLDYYDGETHLASFYLPKDLRMAINNEQKIISDEKPFYVYTD